MTAEERAYRESRETAERNDDVLAFVLTGSRARGFENRWSDYDYALFVNDDALPAYQTRFASRPAGGHRYLFTLPSFAAHAIFDQYRARLVLSFPDEP